jgi:hypothetical protein
MSLTLEIHCDISVMFVCTTKGCNDVGIFAQVQTRVMHIKLISKVTLVKTGYM